MTDDAQVTENTQDTQETHSATESPKPKSRTKRGAGTLPKPVLDAIKSGQASQLARAISKHVGVKFTEKEFRTVLRRKHGFVSGKHGKKLTLSVAVARDMTEWARDLKARRSGK